MTGHRLGGQRDLLGQGDENAFHGRLYVVRGMKGSRLGSHQNLGGQGHE